MFKINRNWSSRSHLIYFVPWCVTLAKALWIVTRSAHLLLLPFFFLFYPIRLLFVALTRSLAHSLLVAIYWNLWPVISLATWVCLSFRPAWCMWDGARANEHLLFLIKLFFKGATHLSCYQPAKLKLSSQFDCLFVFAQPHSFISFAFLSAYCLFFVKLRSFLN